MVKPKVSRLSAEPSPARILWMSSHLPNPAESGIDARHLQMIRSLRAGGSEIVVYAEHATDTGAGKTRLESLGVRPETPPPQPRWNLDPPVTGPASLLAEAPWDLVFIADPHLGRRLMPKVKRLAPGACTIVDLGTVRFPTAHDPSPDVDLHSPAVRQELDALAGADAVVTATNQDRDVLEAAQPEGPVFTWHALGDDGPSASGGDPGGSLLYVGNLFHHPNVQGLDWWRDLVAAQVEGRVGHPVPLRVVGRGGEAYRTVWSDRRRMELVGWIPDLNVELARARTMVVPLTYATGTGGRIASALASGLPVAATPVAAAALPPPLRSLIRVGGEPADLGKSIARLLTDRAFWDAERERIRSVDFPALRRAQEDEFTNWLAARRHEPPTDDRTWTPRRKPGSRRGLLRLAPSS
jgi:glycosyltransferase involved in cell wall biosynthesis